MKYSIKDLSKKIEQEHGSTFGHKLWQYIKHRENLSPKTLDNLALLAGFQSWHDLQSALHGENEAGLNYEEPHDDDTLS